MDDFISIKEGIWKGVSYSITKTEIVEEAGHPLIKFDYEVKGLEESQSFEFEQFLGELLTRAFEFEKERDRIGGGEIGF